MNVSEVSDFSIDNGNISLWYTSYNSFSDVFFGQYFTFNLESFFSGNAVPLETILNTSPYLQNYALWTHVSGFGTELGGTRMYYGTRLVDGYLVFPWVLSFTSSRIVEGFSFSKIVPVTLRDEYTSSDIRSNILGYLLLLSALIMAVYIKPLDKDKLPQ